MKQYFLPFLALFVTPFFVPGQTNVNKFTGDFSYSVPLMQVGANNGPPIPISLNYQAGIRVEQEASEIGLGWNLMAGGAIYRQVSGAADDNKGNSIFDRDDKEFQASYGVLYFADASNGKEKKGDVYRHLYKMDSLSYSAMLPDYDKYYVVGPGIGGQIQPHFWEYINLGMTANTTYGYAAGKNIPSKKMHFSFKNDFSDTLEHRYFPWSNSPISGDAQNDVHVYAPFTEVGSPSSEKDYEGGAYNDEDYMPEYNSNRLRTAKFVEYFTNKEIEDYKSNPTENPIEGGFVEYAASVSRSTGSTFGHRVGAFRVTNESGFTYHYSLPVYVHSIVSAGYDLNYDYTPKDYVTNKDSSGNYIVKNSVSDVVWKYREEANYASKWLLTAITGPDFIDDGDGYLDDGDAGYWVLFTYVKEEEHLITRTPHKGFQYSFSNRGVHYDDFGSDSYLDDYEMEVSNEEKHNGRLGSFTEIDEQYYYLSEIKTAIHQANFTSSSRTDHPDKTRFTEIQLKERSEDSLVKKVKFIQDYSLAPGYYTNSNVTLSNTGFSDSPQMVQSGASFTRNTSSGKLTLNELEFYGTSNEKLHPDYLFDYGQSSTSDNPNYNPLKKDNWGYYRNTSDTSGLFQDASSSSDPDAWSLKSIVSPQGDSVTILYESDKYNAVLNSAHYGGSIGPSRTFVIASIDTVTNRIGMDWKFTLENGEVDFENLIDDIGANNGEYQARLTAVIPTVMIDSSCESQTPSVISRTYDFSYFDEITDFSDVVTTSSPFKLTNMDPYTSSLSLDPVCPGPSVPDNKIAYVGNGFLRLEFDKGWEVMGGGIRVKELRTTNGEKETYSYKYSYQNGTATKEATPFGFSNLNSTETHQITLASGMNHKYNLNEEIGYAQTIEENMGANNLALGKRKYNFNTDCGENGPDIADVEITGIPYYQPYITQWDLAYSGTDPLDFMVEIIDQFSTYWGTPSSTEVLDKNGVSIEKTEYEYEHPIAGAETEVFQHAVLHDDTYDPNHNNSIKILRLRGWNFKIFTYATGAEYTDPSFSVSILREYPTRVKSITTYTNGVFAKVENIKRDLITGEPIETKTTAPNASTAYEIFTPAFREGAYKNMGAKSVHYNYKNLLTNPYQSLSYRDSAIANNGDFAGLSKVLWTTNANVRSYDLTNKEYITDHQNVMWHSNRSYTWRGALDTFGLFDRTAYNEFKPAIILNTGWSGFTGATLYKYADSWVGTSSENGTALTSNELQNSTFMVMDKESLPGGLSLESGLFLYDIDALIDSFPEVLTDDSWSTNSLGGVYAASSTLYSKTSMEVSDDWRVNGWITLLDENNNVIEFRDDNLRYNADKYCFDNSVSYARMAHSNYISFMASGFEEQTTYGDSTYSEGEVNITGVSRTRNKTNAHTGNYFLDLAANKSINYRIIDTASFQFDRTYRASVWVDSSSHGDSYLSVKTVNSSGNAIDARITKSSSETVAAGKWILLNLDVTIPSNSGIDEIQVSYNTTGSGGAKIDDLRFRQIGGKLEVLVYDRNSGHLMSKLDNNNFSVTYEYDERDRIIEVWQEFPGIGKKRIEETIHHYSRDF